MKPTETTNNGRPIEDIDPHEFDPMIEDTLNQLADITYNETVDVSIGDDEGMD